MPVHNEDIAAAFDEIAELLELQQANPFRVRAYRTAARNIRGLGQELSDLVAAGADLTELPGIGEDLAKKIQAFVTRGRLAYLESLRRQLPPGVVELLQVPGLGPKRVRALYEGLGVHSLAGLAQAARDGRLQSLPGFGPKLTAQILRRIETHRTEKKKRFLRAVARQYAEPLRERLAAVDGVEEAVIAGSYRRGRETVGDIDLLVTAGRAAPVMQALAGYDEVAEVLSRGSTRASVVLRSGLQVDLRVVAAESFGAALHYFTGSKAHNIAIRKLGRARGLKINEYGVFRGGRRIAGRTEAEVYAAVDLPYIPPPLREMRGEIEAAQAGRLPRLVVRRDLQGDLHAHTRETDGQLDLEALARAARARGLKYLAITDHSQRLKMVHGLDADRLARQMAAIDALNDRLRGIRLLKGIEVDILEDGSLDLPDRVLCRLDLVVASVHSRFGLGRRRQTERLLRALDQRCLSILGHPTCRLIFQRDPIDVDFDRVLEAARQRGCALELNAQPQRLDLDDVHARAAAEVGIPIAISSDAHSEADLDGLEHGVLQAQRAWLQPGQVLNTRPLRELRRFLRATLA